MKILILKANNIVVYADDSLELTATGVSGAGWINQHITLADAVCENATLPKLWEPLGWTYLNGVWNVVDPVRHNEMVANEEAKQAASVRQSRDAELAATDWTQITDCTADKVTWATYRKSLRDISGQVGFPWTITWPIAP